MTYTDPVTPYPIANGDVIDPNWGNAISGDVAAHQTWITTGGKAIYAGIYLTTSATVSSGTILKLNLASTLFAAVGVTVTGGQFTVVTAGPYLVTGAISFLLTGSGTAYAQYAFINQNTTVVGRSENTMTTGTAAYGNVLPVTALVVAAVGDTISLQAETTGGPTGTISAGSNATYMNAVLLK